MIKRFVLTEKSIKLLEIYNKYVFDVDVTLTKLQIRLVLEKTFFVRVLRVNTYRLLPSVGKSIVSSNARKRAIVTISSGIRIQLY